MNYETELFAGEDKDYVFKMPYWLREQLTWLIFIILLIGMLWFYFG